RRISAGASAGNGGAGNGCTKRSGSSRSTEFPMGRSSRQSLRSNRSRDIRFFVPVHLYGLVLDTDKLLRLRDEHELMVVEDCAQSICGRYRGGATGSAGQLAATSSG